MEDGVISIMMGGITSTSAIGVAFQISGSSFVLPGPSAGAAIGVVQLGGATGFNINTNVAAVPASAGTQIYGRLTLVAVRGSTDPVLTMSGATSALEPTPVVQWTLAYGGDSIGDLSQGTLVLTGFGGGS